jgi:two-component system sensor histidine kinase TctE
MPESGSDGKSPSLRRRLLLFLLVPMLALLLVDGAVTYFVALSYSNRVHDSGLEDDLRTLAQMFRLKRTSGELPEEARFLLEYEPNGHNYYAVRSSKHGLISGNGAFAQPEAPPPDAQPRLYDSELGGKRLRAAELSLRSPADAQDVLTIAIAETLNDRRLRARQILLLTIPLQTVFILGILSLVWLGVTRGLRILEPLTRRLAAREHELGPISGADVPVEILPLTQTIDALFARLSTVLEAQKRFMADAAHQLRTPLAGLSLHTDRALSDPSPETLRDALEHIHKLTGRTTRTAMQLLALTRASNPLHATDASTPVDLALLVPEIVGARVQEALHADIDLGYEGPHAGALILGVADSLRELLDNLIDNALRYAGAQARVTVRVQHLPAGGVALQVEDDGPGVPPELWSRLGERFFRAPGAHEGGSGLGLAIVGQIASQHHARIAYSSATGGGLRVSVQFPPLPA